MRTLPVVALALAAVLAAPVASASASNLTLAASGTAASGEVVPIEVRLRVEDILCSHPRTFMVHMQVTGDSGASGSLDTSALAFQVPARSYFATPYEGTRTVNLSVAGEGALYVFASFSAAEGDCFAPGGIDPASANHTVLVGAAATPPPEQPPAQEPPSEQPPAEEPPAEQPPTQEPSAEEPPAEEPAPEQPPGEAPPVDESTAPGEDAQSFRGAGEPCAPSTSCGWIGDFDGGAVADPNETPGAGALAALAAVAAVAALRRRR